MTLLTVATLFPSKGTDKTELSQVSPVSLCVRLARNAFAHRLMAQSAPG